MTLLEQKQHQAEVTAKKLEITKTLLATDRQRAADVLWQLHYQLSRTTSSITVSPLKGK